MRKISVLFMSVLFVGLLFPSSIFATETNPQVITDMLNRIGGDGASARFTTILDASLANNGKDVFVITSEGNKPCIKGSSLIAISTGINWYLNHDARINLTWNRLTTDLVSASLPVPSSEETHTSSADYRYYLNYCTFSYTMSTWTWKRWQQEIDWMALHGINMPLQVVGSEVLWRDILKELGYADADIASFVAGPCYQAWFMMNNLEGWGGKNPDWWYTRQEQLCKQILSRMREFGMKPVLPGYSGMIPHNAAQKLGWDVANPGTWCAFQRPGFLKPTDTHFVSMAAIYYKHLTELMGTSDFYSMDPFHEGGNTSGLDLNACYKAIETAMLAVNPNAKWVVQNWGSNPRQECLNTVDKGKLVVLDLYADGRPHWKSSNSFSGHEMIFCMLSNFGGRVGLYGRLRSTVNGYYDALAAYPSTEKGVGATPEGIETNPVLYEALYEMPWRSRFDADEWLRDYTLCRYGLNSYNNQLTRAWEQLASSVYNFSVEQQGTSEPVECARPAMVVNSVSTWSTSNIPYKTELVRNAASCMLDAEAVAGSNPNYNYDLIDITRQTISDYANGLLKQINAAFTAGNTARFILLKDRFLNLILDQDSLLNTTPGFMLGHWTEGAKAMANEVSGTTQTDVNWLDWNARTLITVWGNEAGANSGGLHDYSNREWGGLLKDYHYARWKKFFDAKVAGTATPNGSQWYAFENTWTVDHTKSYPTTGTGDPVKVAQSIFGKYFGKLNFNNTQAAIFAYLSTEDKGDSVLASAVRGGKLQGSVSVPDATSQVALYIDYNGDGVYSDNEKNVVTGSGLVRNFSVDVPSTALLGMVKVQLVIETANAALSSEDAKQTAATNLKFSILLRDNVTVPRTVSAKSGDNTMGTVKIAGSSNLSVTTTDDVTISATPKSGYNFVQWYNDKGASEGTRNPFIYTGAPALSLTAQFTKDKWGTPALDASEMSTIQSYGQYLTYLGVEQNNHDATTLYSVSSCPSSLFNLVPNIITAPKGSGFKLVWHDTDINGLSYCRLSAYIDLNSDGDFTDNGEFLEVRGAKAVNTNTTVSNGSLQILLPANIPTGITRIRLRFDGAWSGGWDATTDAKPSKASTQRMIYDIMVNVTEYASAAVTVNAVSNDAAKGVAELKDATNPATVDPGKQVTLLAKPVTDYMLMKWSDQYGRIVSLSPEYTLTPVENSTFTAFFVHSLPDMITIGNWTFPFKSSCDTLKLKKPASGSGALVFPTVYENYDTNYTITELEPAALAGNTGLTAISFSASMLDLGESQQAPFAGCSNLQQIMMASANPNYSVYGSVLYNKDRSTLITYPAARAKRTFAILNTVKKLFDKSFWGVKQIDRITSTLTTPPVCGTDVFTGCTAHCQVAPNLADKYYSAWHLPLLISVNSDQTVSDNITSPIDVVELCATDGNIGSYTSTKVPDHKWLTQTFSSATLFRPMFFSNNVDSAVATDAFSKICSLKIGTDLVIYYFDGSHFVPYNNTELKAGAYLIKPSADWVGRQITFICSSTGTASSTSDLAFTGNGTLSPKTVSGKLYEYDATNDIFKLSASSSATISPFGAYLMANGDAPQEIAGTGFAAGISSATWQNVSVSVKNGKLSVTGCTKFRVFDTKGALLNPNGQFAPGVYILSTNKGSFRFVVK